MAELLISCLFMQTADDQRQLVTGSVKRAGSLFSTSFLTESRFRVVSIRDDLALTHQAYRFLRVPKGPLGNSAAVFLSSWREVVSNDGVKHRFTADEARVGDKSWPGEERRSYDGKACFHWHPQKRMVNVAPGPGAGRVLNDVYGDCVGFGRSIRASTVFFDFSGQRRLDDAIGDSRYVLHGSPALVEGEPCVLLECKGLDRIWLSTQKDYALIKRESHWSEGGPLRMRIQNGEFVAIREGLTLARKCRIEVFGHPARSAGKVCAAVEALLRDYKTQLDPRHFDFSAELPIGTFVRDETVGETYLVGRDSNGDLLKHPFSDAPDRPSAASRSLWAVLGDPRSWFVVGIGLLIVASWLRRRNRRAQGR